VPAQYVWTPSGYVFVDGYWDYAPVRRGVVFAPVRVKRVVHTRRSFVYSPRVVIDVNLAVGHFFARPRVRHYYFGDYYAREYIDAGVYPSFAFHLSRYGYDPIYAREVVIHRRVNPRWEVSVRADYFRRRDHVELRPVRTYVTRRTVERKPVRKSKVVSIARPLHEVVARPAPGVRFVKIDTQQREKVVRVARETRDYRRVRAEREVPERVVKPRADRKTTRSVRRVEMPPSPLERGGQRSKATVRQPPPRPKTPSSDAKVKVKSVKRPEPRKTLRRKTSRPPRRP
jgi:hypothetical protein